MTYELFSSSDTVSR